MINECKAFGGMRIDIAVSCLVLILVSYYQSPAASIYDSVSQPHKNW